MSPTQSAAPTGEPTPSHSGRAYLILIVTVATFALYVCMYLVNQMFPPVKEHFDTHVGSPAGLFVILAVICLGGVGFIARMAPETKGKSLEEISAHWLKRSA